MYITLSIKNPNIASPSVRYVSFSLHSGTTPASNAGYFAAERKDICVEGKLYAYGINVCTSNRERIVQLICCN